MKKILIATACAFTLCFTSCASKKAPETETQTQTPQTETEQNDNLENEEGSEENEKSKSSADSEKTENSIDLTLNSEDFPEPEEISEPEIITLEPEEETEKPDTSVISEKVENEEPPVIAETESKTDTETAAVETQKQDIEVTGISDSDDDGVTVIGGAIDITDISDEDSPAEEKYSEKTENIVPSRSVTLKKFEYLDVTYPGSGWIYMGLVDNSKDLAYFGRKLGTKDTKFSLQARGAGTKIVHFYRNDPLTGNYLDDYIEIIILAENGSNKTHIEAPEYKLPVQKKEKPVKKSEAVEEQAPEKEEAKKEEAAKKTEPVKTENKQKSPAKTDVQSDIQAAVQTPAPVQVPAPVQATDSARLLNEAQLLYNEKEYSAALNKLNQFFEYSTEKRDEALYLKGQILEAKSNVRDIKGAIDAYTSLTKNYPASKLWDSANKRIIYLKRFYLEVR